MRTGDVLDMIDAAVDDWETGPDAMRMNAPPQQPFTWRPNQRYATVNITVDLAPFRRAMEDMAKAFAKVTQVINRNGGIAALRRAAFLMAHPEYDGHHPEPLCINGHAYHQRRRNRRKRR